MNNLLCEKKMFKMLICDRLFALLCFKEIATCFKCTCNKSWWKATQLMTSNQRQYFKSFMLLLWRHWILSLGFTASWILLMCLNTSLMFAKDYCWDFKKLSPQPTKTWILKYETNYMLSHLQCAIILQIL